MRLQRVILRQPGHHACIAQEYAFHVLNGPSRDALAILGNDVALEFFTTVRSTDRPSIVRHDFGIGMHQRERLAVPIVP